jgi:sulfur relay (sulfurtransferase) complex TusBCD TusD component (DsrE family)
MKVPFIVNDPHTGTERAYNALRLAVERDKVLVH